jgi:hypothetical protein
MRKVIAILTLFLGSLPLFGQEPSAGTQLARNDISNIHYADQYNWRQSPSGWLTGGTPTTITLTPSPRGIDTSASATYPFYVYIAGVGTPEAVQVTGGTCTAAGVNSCTIQFTPVNDHGAGFTVQSATGGVAEAGYAANQNGANESIVLRPAGSGVNNNAYTFVFYAPWFPRLGRAVIEGAGAVIGVNNKRAGIVFNSGNNQGNTIRNLRFLSMLTLTGAAITHTACSGTTATITTTLNPAVGDVVDVMLTTDQFYWGPHTVVTSSRTQYTYTARCGPGHPSTASAGYANWQLAAIEDNGFGTHMRDINIESGAAPYDGLWNNGIVVLSNEQDAFIDGLEASYGNCSAATNWCASLVYAPFYPAIVKLTNSDLSPQCSANGVTYYGGNSLAIDNTVIQGYSMWGVRSGTRRGGYQGTSLTNVYQEIGSCTNPFYTPNQQVGLDQYGSPAIVIGGVMGSGKMPTFATGGRTTYQYYLVVHTTGGGSVGPNQSGPIVIGTASPSGSSVPISFSRASDDGVGGTTTYDIIRSTDINNAPTTAACTGGATSACGAVVVSLAQCSSANLQCSFTDDVSANTTAYAVLAPSLGGSGVAGASYVPTFTFFPGNFTLQKGAWLNFQGGNLNSSGVGVFGGVSAMNSIGPVYTDAAPVKTNSYLRIDGRFSGSSGGTSPNVRGTIPLLFYKQSAGQLSNAMGHIIMVDPLLGLPGGAYTTGEYAITTATPNSQQVLAANGYRVTASANDSGIGFDSNVTYDPAGLSSGYASPSGHSFYVGSLLNGTSWLERLTASLKSFKVPITTNSQLISTLTTGTVPLVITSSTPVANLTVSNHPKVYESGVLTTSDKIYTNRQALSTGTATHTFANGFTYTSSSTFGCTCTDQTAANACRAAPASATTVTLAGTGSDVLWLLCNGH